MNVSRRQFFLGLIVGASVTVATTTLYLNYPSTWRWLTGFVPDGITESPKIGQRIQAIFGFSKADMAKADWSRFVRPSFDKDTIKLWQMMKDRELKDFLTASIKRDYFEGKVVEADGWLLSETEVFLYSMSEAK